MKEKFTKIVKITEGIWGIELELFVSQQFFDSVIKTRMVNGKISYYYVKPNKDETQIKEALFGIMHNRKIIKVYLPISISNKKGEEIKKSINKYIVSDETNGKFIKSALEYNSITVVERASILYPSYISTLTTLSTPTSRFLRRLIPCNSDYRIPLLRSMLKGSKNYKLLLDFI